MRNPVGWILIVVGVFACTLDTEDRSKLAPVPYSYGALALHDEPVLRRGDAGAWDDGLVDPGAVVFLGGRFHALYNAIRDWPTPLSVGYATSFDGMNWERQAARPVLTKDALPWDAWTLRANSALVEDGQWVLYFSVSHREGWLIGSVGRATSESPGGPWSIDSSMVLAAGAGWDQGGVGDAKVIPGTNGYVMFYTGRTHEGTTAIGRAISPDGIVWEKDTEPILQPGPSGAWDDEAVSDASVARSPDGGWIMVYRGSDGETSALGWSRSPDGVSWKNAAEPFLTRQSSDAFDVIYYTSLVAIQTRQLVFFEAGLDQTGRTDVFLASRAVSIAR